MINALRESGRGSRPRDRLRPALVPLIQAAVAAGLAWFLVHDVIGHEHGIFGPIGALYALSQAPGRPSRRVLEAALGAALGVAVGDVLIGVIGTGPAQVGLVAGLAMGAAILLGAAPGVVAQAGIASVLIATVQPPHELYSALASERLVDILVGGGVGLALSVVLPANPLRTTYAVLDRFCSEVSGTLEQVADALDAHDLTDVEDALQRARTLDGHIRELHHTLEPAQETARLAPIHWGKRAAISRLAGAAVPLELAARNVRVLARAAVRVVELEPGTPPELAIAVRDLASAVRALRSGLERDHDTTEAVDAVVRAAGRATLVVGDGASMAVSALVAQVRSTATDLLRALGLDRSDAVERVRRAADALAGPEPPDGRAPG